MSPEDRDALFGFYRAAVKNGLRQIPRDGLRRLRREIREHPERVLLDGEIYYKAQC